jgi:hypothetical protein
MYPKCIDRIEELVQWIIDQMVDEMDNDAPGSRRYMIEPVSTLRTAAIIKGTATEDDYPSVIISGRLACDLLARWPSSRRSGGRSYIGTSGMIDLATGAGSVAGSKVQAEVILGARQAARARRRELTQAVEHRIPHPYREAWMDGWTPPGTRPHRPNAPRALAGQGAAGLAASFRRLDVDFP